MMNPRKKLFPDKMISEFDNLINEIFSIDPVSGLPRGDISIIFLRMVTLRLRLGLSVICLCHVLLLVVVVWKVLRMI